MISRDTTSKFYFIKVSFFYVCLFGLFYSEPLLIFGVKIAVIWKIVLIIIMMPTVFNYLFHKNIELFVVFALLLSIKMFINLSSTFEYLNMNLSIVVKNSMLPMMFIYLSVKMNKNKLLFLARHLSIFTILSFIPFLMHVLEPLSKGYHLAAFGEGENVFGLVGLFMGPHSASESIAIMLIVIYYLYQNEKKIFYKYFYATLLIFGAYEMILTYARSGLVIAGVGITYLYLKENSRQKFSTFFFLIFPMIIGIIFMFQTNKVFQMRLEDKNIYKQQELGSGRLDIATNAVHNWSTDSIPAIFIGLGYNYGLEKMERSIHNKIFAHNNFIQILQQEGLIGFIIFILFLYYLLKYIQNYKFSQYYNVTMSLYFGFILEMLLQGNFLFLMQLIITVYLVLLKDK